MITFSLFMKENRPTIVEQRWPMEIHLNLKPTFHLIKGEAGKKGSRCEELVTSRNKKTNRNLLQPAATFCLIKRNHIERGRE